MVETKAAVGGTACLPNVIGFPQANAVVGGKNGTQNWVWRVDVDSGTGEKLELPQPKPTGQVKWNSYAMSPFPSSHLMEESSHLGDPSLHGILLTRSAIAGRTRHYSVETGQGYRCHATEGWMQLWQCRGGSQKWIY
jgi:hypothetical protein